MIFLRKIYFVTTALILSLFFIACKKDKIINDASVQVRFSQDSVLFDTVFTTIGSSTRNIRVINDHNQRIRISNISLTKGTASQFIINVDGAKGTSFNDIEIAAHDSLYIFIQVNVNPTNSNSPLIVNDAINFTTNGNFQQVVLEAWGQDAYYHYPKNALKFSNGSYLPYSLISSNPNADTVWNNDKPHVIYGWLVVDSAQKLTINAGTRLYFNNKAGLWVYRYGTLKVHGTYGNEVLFTQARRDPEYVNEPGGWDRIWINEGSLNNEIDYAIIKNGYIGVQAELLGNNFNEPKRLRITNTKIYNMSKWGLYGFGFNIYGGNNVISNCQEHCVNLSLGGNYSFIHCTISNFWEGEKSRDKPTLNINNYTTAQVLPLDTCLFLNCIIDGKFNNEISLDLNYTSATFTPNFAFSNSWLKTTLNTSDQNKYINIRTGSSLNYIDPKNYNFELNNGESQVKNFIHSQATQGVLKFPNDIKTNARNTTSVIAGAYIVN